SRISVDRAIRSYLTISWMTDRMSLSDATSLLPRVTWLEIWKKSPRARLPSPYNPRTTRLIFWRALNALSICLARPRAGRWSMTLARIPVLTLVGQEVQQQKHVTVE